MKQWYNLGTDVMKEARTKQGLSYEAMGRLLHTSAKTYERWEKRGQVPRAPAGTVERVAQELGLEIEYDGLPPQKVTLTTPDPTMAEATARIAAAATVMESAAERFVGVLERLEDRLDDQEAARPVARKP